MIWWKERERPCIINDSACQFAILLATNGLDLGLGRQKVDYE